MPQRPKIADNILELIGYTPLVRLHRIPHPNSAELICKLESQNQRVISIICDFGERYLSHELFATELAG
ncbi:MAG: hypothetical protein M3480_00210 [Verrucomicrobiota bacterium]|nr:hypothetical protein [Verrucomicrobiota bacterium]